MPEDKPIKTVTKTTVTKTTIYEGGEGGLAEPAAIQEASPGWPENATVGWLFTMPLKYAGILVSALIAAFVLGFWVGQMPTVQKLVTEFSETKAQDGDGAEAILEPGGDGAETD